MDTGKGHVRTYVLFTYLSTHVRGAVADDVARLLAGHDVPEAVRGEHEVLVVPL